MMKTDFKIHIYLMHKEVGGSIMKLLRPTM